MLDALMGIGCGMAVCVFGMWCFIHGQHNAADLLGGRKPAQFSGPVKAVTRVVTETKERKEAAAAQDELEKLMAYDGGLSDERRDEA